MAIGAVTTGFTACSDDDDYEWAPLPEGQEVYFASNLSSTITLSSVENSFSIPLKRADATAAATVTISASADDENTVLDAFTIPTSVSFAAGEKETPINITYDFEKIDFDNTQSITLKLTDENIDGTYGATSFSFKATCPAPWTAIGTGTIVEKWWFEESFTVTFYQNDLNPNTFRVTNPFAKYNGLPSTEYFQFTIAQPGETIYGITLTKPDIVYYSDMMLEYYDYYDDDIYILFPGRFTSLQSETNYMGNYVVSYQDNGLPAEIRLSPAYYMFNTGGWTNMLSDENVQILFPGIKLIDASVEVTYNGMFKSVDDEQSVVASVTLGADVESAKVAIVAGGDPNAGVDAIIAGSVETITVTQSGEIKIPFDADNAEGRYSVVAVTYYDGEAQEGAGDVFTYVPANAEQWTLIGTGTYTYEHFWEGDDEGLELYQSESDPTRYKITHWGYDVDFKFTMDEDGIITVADQETGEVVSSYGMSYVIEMIDYTGDDEDERSYYEDGVFNFNVVYYVSAGVFGYGFETFTLDTEAANSRAIKAHSPRKLSNKLKIDRNFTLDKNIRLN